MRQKKSISFVLWQEEELKDDPNKLNSYPETISGLKNSHEVNSRKTKKNFVMCYSRKLSKSETGYSIYKLELMSALSGLQHALSLLLFEHLNLYIDCKSLLFLRLSRNQNDQLVRFSVMFNTYNVTLFHISSENNYLADLFTKIPSNDEDVESKYRCLTEAESHELVKNLTIPANFTLSAENLQRLLKEDSVKCILKEATEKRKAKKSATKKDISPSLKAPRKPKPFQIVVKKGICRELIRVNMVEGSPVPGSSTDNTRYLQTNESGCHI